MEILSLVDTLHTLLKPKKLLDKIKLNKRLDTNNQFLYKLKNACTALIAYKTDTNLKQTLSILIRKYI